MVFTFSDAAQRTAVPSISSVPVDDEPARHDQLASPSPARPVGDDTPTRQAGIGSVGSPRRGSRRSSLVMRDNPIGVRGEGLERRGGVKERRDHQPAMLTALLTSLPRRAGRP